MKGTLSELVALSASWAALAAARPAEMDFANIGFSNLNGTVMQSGIDDLKEVVDAYLAKSRFVEREEIQLADGASIKALREIRGWVDSARSNGLAWLLNNSDFLPRLSWVFGQIRILVGRNADLRAKVVKLAADEVQQDFASVQAAAEAAQDLLDLQKDLSSSRQSASDAEREITDALTRIRSALADAQGAEKEFASVKEAVNTIASDVATKGEAVSRAQTQAEKAEGEIERSKDDLLSSVEDAIGKSNEAIEQLDRALRDARRQGLAKAFNDRYRSARFEYFTWVALLFSAMFILALLGYLQFKALHAGGGLLSELINVVNGRPSPQVTPAEALGRLYATLVNFLSELPLAIPLIWLGWYSAKRVSVISRLMQDYEYKAATALAFEGYKNEAQILGSDDDDLFRRLLEVAISNFGDNPVRLMGGASNDHGHPLEGLIEAIKDEKNFERMMKLIDKLRS